MMPRLRTLLLTLLVSILLCAAAVAEGDPGGETGRQQIIIFAPDGSTRTIEMSDPEIEKSVPAMPGKSAPEQGQDDFLNDAAVRQRTFIPELVAPASESVSTETAGQKAAADDVEPEPQDVWNVSLTSGYRVDELKFNIAGLFGTPNVLSELTWTDLEAAELSLAFRWRPESGFYLRGGIDYGWIQSGDCQDSDYYGDNRTEEFSRSYSDSDGSLIDADAAIGYRIEIPSSSGFLRLGLAPVYGYSVHMQNLNMTDGIQVVSEDGTGLGPFSGLDSSYDTRWDGSFVGLDIDLALGARHELTSSFEYHWLAYEAEENWNLRSDFEHPVSFRHEANGRGLIARAGYRFRCFSNAWLGLNLNYRKLETDSGSDKTYFADGTSVIAPLNEVIWESWSAGLSLSVNF